MFKLFYIVFVLTLGAKVKSLNQCDENNSGSEMVDVMFGEKDYLNVLNKHYKITIVSNVFYAIIKPAGTTIFIEINASKMGDGYAEYWILRNPANIPNRNYITCDCNCVYLGKKAATQYESKVWSDIQILLAKRNFSDFIYRYFTNLSIYLYCGQTYQRIEPLRSTTPSIQISDLNVHDEKETVVGKQLFVCSKSNSFELNIKMVFACMLLLFYMERIKNLVISRIFSNTYFCFFLKLFYLRV